MPWAWSSPAKEQNKGGKKGNGKGGGGAKATAGSGGAAADAKVIAALQKQMAELLKASTAKAAAKPAADPKKHWTCTHCGDTRCFLSRKECHQCGKPRQVATPPGLAGATAAAAAVEDGDGDKAMEEIAELSLEDKIKGLTADIRWMKVSPVPQTKSQVVHYEEELQKLLDLQRNQKPLPARMQAASAKDERAKAAFAEATKQLAAAEEEAIKQLAASKAKVQAAKEHLEDATKQAKEAELEMIMVKKAAGEDLASSAAAVMMGAVEQVLGQVHDAKVVHEMCVAIRLHCQLLMGSGVVPAGPPPLGPLPPLGAQLPAAAGSQQTPAQQQLPPTPAAAEGLPQAAAVGSQPQGKPRGRSPAARSESSAEESGGEFTRSRSDKRRKKKERRAAKKAAEKAENPGSGGSQ
jgi:hypothetical protein